jgi:hypothetical protein
MRWVRIAVIDAVDTRLINHYLLLRIKRIGRFKCEFNVRSRKGMVGGENAP